MDEPEFKLTVFEKAAVLIARIRANAEMTVSGGASASRREHYAHRISELCDQLAVLLSNEQQFHLKGENGDRNQGHDR